MIVLSWLNFYPDDRPEDIAEALTPTWTRSSGVRGPRVRRAHRTDDVALSAEAGTDPSCGSRQRDGKELCGDSETLPGDGSVAEI